MSVHSLTFAGGNCVRIVCWRGVQDAAAAARVQLQAALHRVSAEDCVAEPRHPAAQALFSSSSQALRLEGLQCACVRGCWFAVALAATVCLWSIEGGASGVAFREVAAWALAAPVCIEALDVVDAAGGPVCIACCDGNVLLFEPC